MPYGRVYDFEMDLARGYVPDHSLVQKFGRAPNGLQTTATDLWPRADSTPTQQIWLAPTAARVHAIVSSSANDDGSPVGTGARTIRVTGLTSWSAVEVSEDITMNGTTPVNTVNSYVMINRMVVLTSGASGPNVGTITATAATDSTVTALISVGYGQTQQTPYGIPSNQTLFVKSYSTSINDGTATVRADVSFLVNPFPDVQPTVFINKYHTEANNSGTSRVVKEWFGFLKVPGPAICKIQCICSAADVDAAGGFDGVLVNGIV
jgi:hypothetical protein